MTPNDAARSLAALLREENAHLLNNDAAAAARCVSDKQAAIAAFQAALPGNLAAIRIEPAVATDLRGLVQQNRTLLAAAIETQGRILAMVAHAARRTQPGPVRYAATGTHRTELTTMALQLRA